MTACSMRAQHIIDFQVSSWLLKFQHVTYRTILIPLPPNFVQNLIADGIFVPEGSLALPKRTAVLDTTVEDEYQDWSEDEDEAAGTADTGEAAQFPELLADIQRAIDVLGGAVSPKLNWSCPKDAVWVATGNTHRCTNAEEVLLLLKASDRVAHDICHAFEGLEDVPQQPLRFSLALRKWHALRPMREFRCFVRGHDLIGVSQRHVTEHFPGLEAQKEEFLELVLEFFEQHIERKFPGPDFAFDIYITTANKVRLLDFNPIGSTTNPLLFSWEELGYTGELPEQGYPTQGACEQRSLPCEDLPSPNGAKASGDSLQNRSTMAQVCGVEQAQEAEGASLAIPGPAGDSSTSLTNSRQRLLGSPAAINQNINSTSAESSRQEQPILSQSDSTVVEKAVNKRKQDGCQGRDVSCKESTVSQGIEFRIVTEPNRVQPNLPTWGVPYDLVDSSESGAYQDLLQHLEAMKAEQDWQ